MTKFGFYFCFYFYVRLLCSVPHPAAVTFPISWLEPVCSWQHLGYFFEVLASGEVEAGLYQNRSYHTNFDFLFAYDE